MTRTVSKNSHGRRRSRVSRPGNDYQAVSSPFGWPDFVVRIVGWRKLKSATADGWPRYRHE